MKWFALLPAWLAVAPWAVGVLAGCDKDMFSMDKMPWATPAEPDAKTSAQEDATVFAGLRLRSHGKPVVSLKVRDLQRRVKGEQPKVLDPFEHETIAFEGVAVPELLDSAYGLDWSAAASIEVRTRDGRRLVLPAQRFRTHKAWLAWRRMDRPDFRIAGKDIAPLYLIWDSLGDPVVAADGEFGWIGQVAAFDLVDVVGDLNALTLPADASPAALAGLKHFRQYCASCHSVNGHGGASGGELNVPVSVTEFWQAAWLATYIDNPSQVRARSAMPKLPAHVQDRAGVIAELIAYLREMAGRKVPNKPESPR